MVAEEGEKWKVIHGRGKRWMTGGDIDMRSRRWQRGGGQWRRREEGEEGSYLLLMAVRVSEGWRAIQL